MNLDDLSARFQNFLADYKSCNFCFNVRSLILSLPRKCMLALWNIVQNWLSLHSVPDRIIILIKVLIAFRNRTSNNMVINSAAKESKIQSGFMTVHYQIKALKC